MRLLFSLLLFSSLKSALWAGTSSSADYTITASVLDQGGGRSSSTSYTHDSSLSSEAQGLAFSPHSFVKHGYIGQLYEAVALQLASQPPILLEASSSQLFAVQVMDDATLASVPPTSVTWSTTTPLLTQVNASGVVTVATVTTNSVAQIQGAYQGHTGTLSLSILDLVPSNTPPVANPDTLGTTENAAVSVIARKYTLNDFDFDGDSIAITAVSSASSMGGSVTLNNGIISYTPAAGFFGADSFTYSLSDGRGGAALGQVTVYVTPANALSSNAFIRLTPSASDLSFYGIPGNRYVIQWSRDLLTWQDLTLPLTAGLTGAIQYRDEPPMSVSGPRFYRTIPAP